MSSYVQVLSGWGLMSAFYFFDSEFPNFFSLKETGLTQPKKKVGEALVLGRPEPVPYKSCVLGTRSLR